MAASYSISSRTYAETVCAAWIASLACRGLIVILRLCSSDLPCAPLLALRKWAMPSTMLFKPDAIFFRSLLSQSTGRSPILLSCYLPKFRQCVAVPVGFPFVAEMRFERGFKDTASILRGSVRILFDL